MTLLRLQVASLLAEASGKADKLLAVLEVMIS